MEKKTRKYRPFAELFDDVRTYIIDEQIKLEERDRRTRAKYGIISPDSKTRKKWHSMTSIARALGYVRVTANIGQCIDIMVADGLLVEIEVDQIAGKTQYRYALAIPVDQLHMFPQIVLYQIDEV